MQLFEKKTPVFRKRDRKMQERIREVLDQAGIWNRCTHFEQEEIPVGGYSAMDPRNFSSKGRIDREVYAVYVKEAELERAREVIHDAGLVAEVMSPKELTSEASRKIRNRKY